ncbi:Disease resistance protein [Actinidia chinensis var. chinensis]|uniref:Disease resistance protein n=1 Tax=Actinidia chinensis var. chinensis TaxID=1590841 RepID=A0A2R6RTW2_ACTCC|nr:Disease resistance protein [Actinidia chinensis var. chinensis]
MCSPQGIMNNIIGKAMDAAFQAVKCAIHYKENHKDLRDEMEKFKEYRKDIIERKVEAAQNRGEDILAAVLSWRREADEMTQDFDNFMQQCNREESMLCFACVCPNFIRRYRLSKQAQEKKDKVIKLKQEGHFDEVARPKSPPPELLFRSEDDYEIFDSRASVFKDVVDALKDSKVTVIGVHGTGGVGKTTLVKEVGKQLKEDRTFDEVVMAVVSKDANVSKIQSQLVGPLNLGPINAATEEQISYKLWHRLNNGKKNLVILDDIWKEVNLKAIGIPVTDGNQCCKVVITSRNRRVLQRNMKVDRDFALQLLPEPEAWALFKKVAGNSVDSPELYSLAYAVCKECKGLPVAINALGAALKDKEISSWNTALVKLERSLLSQVEDIDPTVYTSLKLSYDELESSDAKSCFLLCCLFPEDAEILIDDLTRLCMARSLLQQNPYALEEARDAVCTAVGTLKTRYLFLDDTSEDVVKMHDVTRDVGISIAEAFLVEHGFVREWPKKRKYESYSAISIRSQSIDELPNELACPQLRILMLESNYRSWLKVPDGFFSRMKELEVIDFNRMCMSPLPSSLRELKNLQMLCLNNCKLADIDILKDLQDTLQMLSLRGSEIEVLPPEIARLTRLRLLDLRVCYDLKVIPHGVISHLTCLEELYFPDKFYQWDKNKSSGNVSLDELRLLTRLTTLHVHIPKDMLFPKESFLNFENLVRFKISIGGMFEVFERYLGTRILKLEGIPLKDELNTLVDKVEGLHLSGVDGLKNVLHNRGGGEGFLNLKYLEVQSCYDSVDHLLGKPKWSMQPSRSFNKLTKIIIRDCRLKYLFSPSSVRGLLQLQKLTVSDCKILEGIIGFEGEKDEDELTYFSKLKDIELEKLPNLTSFYPKLEKTSMTVGNSSIRAQSLFNEKVALPALETLRIFSCSQIKDVWDVKILPENSFFQLKELMVSLCDNLVNVFQSNMVSRLQNLQKVAKVNCHDMEVKECNEGAEPNDLILFPRLTNLKLLHMKNLKSFCDNSRRSDSQPLFNHQLRHMTVHQCANLVNVFQSNMVSRLQNLQEVDIDYCPYMEVIISNKGEEAEPNDNIVLPQLRNLYLRSLKNLKSFCTTRSEAGLLFNHKVVFPALNHFEMHSLPNITEIWSKQALPEPEEEVESFFQLTSIAVDECNELVSLIPSHMLPQLQKLQNLRVENCPEIETIVSGTTKDEEFINNDIIVFPELSILTLDCLKKLKSFCTSTSEAQLFFNNKVVFPALNHLKMHSLPNITEIWSKQALPEPEEEVESFFQLTSIAVDECNELVNVIPSHMLSQLQKLQKLSVRSCPEIETIVSRTTKEENVLSNDIIVFPELSILML